MHQCAAEQREMVLMKRGLLITFEGTEGSGKSTQARLLFDWLRSQEVPCIMTREPGGTEVGEAIRNVLLNPAFRNLSAKTELLLMLAARAQLVSELVLPAIQDGKVVISDRFSDSTFAYQVSGRDLPGRPTMLFNRFATAGLKPDLTFLVDIPAEQGLSRAKAQGADRIETEDACFHQRVRQGYIRLAKRARGRIKLLDGSGTIDEIQKTIREKTQVLLLKRGYKP